MKIRQGFVSNSSSSSFVVQLNKDIDDYVDYEEFASEYEIPENEDTYGYTLYKDLKANSLKSQLDSLDEIRVDLHGTTNLDFEWYDDLREIEKTLSAKAVKMIEKKLRQKYKDNTITVEYEDHDEIGKYMEQKFMPHFEGTKEIINHH